jgi:hypothetical protein
MKTSSSHFERRTDLREESGGVVPRHPGDGGGGGGGVAWPLRSCLVPPADGATNWGCSLIPPQSGGSLLWVPPRGCTVGGDDGDAAATPPSPRG